MVNLLMGDANVHPAFQRMFAAPKPTEADTLRKALLEACAELESMARNAYVIHGQPETQEEFEAVWQEDQPVWYDQWRRLSRVANRKWGAA